MVRYMHSGQPGRRIGINYYNLATVMAIAYRVKSDKAEAIIHRIWLQIYRGVDKPYKVYPIETVAKLRERGFMIA